MCKSKWAFLLIMFWSFGIPYLLMAQKSKKIDKNYFVIDIDAGLSFADFDENQPHWKPSFYPTLSLGILWNRRMNACLDFDLGAGGTFYYLINKGTIDRYVLDFASLYLITGLGYSFMQKQKEELFIKVSGIMQIGFNDTFREEFPDYVVDIESDSQYYYSIKTQFGLRRFFKNRQKNKSKPAGSEYGIYFRYSFQDLGTATFTGADYSTAISPVGHLAGVFYRLMFTYGGGKVSRNVRLRKTKEIPPPPIIYNPRF